MSWARLPGPGETEALLAGLARAGAPGHHATMHAAIRALALWQPAPRPRPTQAILQFWDQPAPPEDVLASLESWHRAGPPVTCFSDAGAAEWLRDAFGLEALAAYLHCHHPAMRSDLFRLAWLLREGGFYVDADDAFIGDAALPDFEAGLVLLPLAQHGHEIVPVEHGLQVAAGGAYIGFFANNAPLYAQAGHPVLEAALGSALAHLHGCMARGERGDIHEHTGPSNLNHALMAYLAQCLRQGVEPDVAVRLDWPWLLPFQPMAYKQGERNWRSGVSLY